MPAEGGDLRSEADLSQDEDRVMGIAWSSVDTSSIAVVTEQSIRIEALPGSSSKVHCHDLFSCAIVEYLSNTTVIKSSAGQAFSPKTHLLALYA